MAPLRIVPLSLLSLLLAPALLAQDTLDFRTFITSVNERHPRATSARMALPMAEQEIQAARGKFDPVVSSDVTFKAEDGKNKYDDAQLGVSLPLNTLFGPKFKAAWKRGRGPNINPQSLTDPSGYAVLGVALPLWQGVETDEARTALRRAQLEPDKAQAEARQELNALTREAATFYWSWAETASQLSVNRTMFEIAQQRIAQVRIRARVGAIADIDTVEALAELARRRTSLVKAEQKYQKASAELVAFLWQTDDPTVELLNVPGVLPSPEVPDSSAVVAEIEQAFVRRPELAALAVSAQQTDLDAALAREGQKPLVTSSVELFSPTQDPSLPNFQATLSLSIPIFFRTATAKVEMVEIKRRMIDLKQAEQSRKISVEISKALVELRNAAELYEVAQQEAQLMTTLRIAEQRKYDEGASTLFVLNARERSEAEALTKVIEAQADILKALTDYFWAVGNPEQIIALAE